MPDRFEHKGYEILVGGLGSFEVAELGIRTNTLLAAQEGVDKALREAEAAISCPAITPKGERVVVRAVHKGTGKFLLEEHGREGIQEVYPNVEWIAALLQVRVKLAKALSVTADHLANYAINAGYSRPTPGANARFEATLLAATQGAQGRELKIIDLHLEIKVPKEVEK